MKGFDAWSFGALNADVYDATQTPESTEASIDCLAGLAGTGRVLELATGTGRIALPLAARGIDVTGLEISPEMIAKLRAKPGGAELPVVEGDMAEIPLEGPFDLVVLVFNTLFNLQSQEAQVRCFQNVARVLRPGGQFLIEAFVPEVTRFDDDQNVRVKHLDAERLVLDAIMHDPIAQTLSMQRLHTDGAGSRLVPLFMRYAYPAELDLMAQMAGMSRSARWSDWAGTPFTRHSRSHITIYRKDSA